MYNLIDWLFLFYVHTRQQVIVYTMFPSISKCIAMFWRKTIIVQRQENETGIISVYAKWDWQTFVQSIRSRVIIVSTFCKLKYAYSAELVMSHFFKTQTNPTQNFWTQPNPQKSPPDPTQPIIDNWYGILGYTENFIQQLLHVTDKFTVYDSYYSAAVLISRQ